MGVPLVCRCGNRAEASPEFLARHGLRCAKCRRRMMPQAWFEGQVRRVGSAPGDGGEEDLLDGMDGELLAALEVGLKERAGRDGDGSDSQRLAGRMPVRDDRALRPVEPPDPDRKARRLAGLALIGTGFLGGSFLSLAATATAYGFVAVMVLLVCVLACAGGVELVRRNGGV